MSPAELRETAAWLAIGLIVVVAYLGNLVGHALARYLNARAAYLDELTTRTKWRRLRDRPVRRAPQPDPPARPEPLR